MYENRETNPARQRLTCEPCSRSSRVSPACLAGDEPKEELSCFDSLYLKNRTACSSTTLGGSRKWLIEGGSIWVNWMVNGTTREGVKRKAKQCNNGNVELWRSGLKCDWHNRAGRLKEWFVELAARDLFRLMGGNGSVSSCWLIGVLFHLTSK